jgi:hypothetical protein
MPTKQQFTGYHGTPKSYVDSILKNGYTLSDNYQWFGRGIYFFGDNLPYFSGEQDAINWVLYVKEENEWAVFCATIVADKYFDMCGNTSDRVYYERLRDELLDRHRKANRRDETFSDRIVLNICRRILIFRPFVRLWKPAKNTILVM